MKYTLQSWRVTTSTGDGYSCGSAKARGGAAAPSQGIPKQEQISAGVMQ